MVSNFELGRWSYEEHKRFVRSIVKYPNNWEKITKEVKTRSDVQIRSHSQKFFKKLKKGKMEPIKLVYICDLNKKEIIGNYPIKGKENKKYNEKIKSILNTGNFSEEKLLNEEEEKSKIS